MKHSKLLLIATFSLTAISGYAVANSTSISCGSAYETGRTFCELPENVNRVSLDRLTSHNACEFGVNWGLEDNHLWTEDGCQAQFLVVFGEEYDREEDDPQEPVRRRYEV